jgi:predicted restriction endonuclease
MFDRKQPDIYGTLWTREELILAFDLYCRIPFRKTKANNPEVIELAKLLKRSPASVARKLGNFGSFDPALRAQQIKGLVHASTSDREVWEEFNTDWNRLVLEARQLRDALEPAKEPEETAEDEILVPLGASEREAIRRIRVHQAFFREAVLSSYEDRCCITGLKIKECLVASHIIPWSKSEQYRTDPRNGLCLSATFDRLFDRGLVTLTRDLEVVVSASLLRSGDKRIEEMVCGYHRAPMIRPLRFLPLESCLEWHRSNLFHD